MNSIDLLKQTAIGSTQIFCASRGIEFEAPEAFADGEATDLPIESEEIE